MQTVTMANLFSQHSLIHHINHNDSFTFNYKLCHTGFIWPLLRQYNKKHIYVDSQTLQMFLVGIHGGPPHNDDHHQNNCFKESHTNN